MPVPSLASQYSLAALDGSSELDSVKATKAGIEILAHTSVPTGGKERDDMGIERPKMLTRAVVAYARQDGDKVLGFWVSAPEDEWRKPTTGTRLRAVVESFAW